MFRFSPVFTKMTNYGYYRKTTLIILQYRFIYKYPLLLVADNKHSKALVSERIINHYSCQGLIEFGLIDWLKTENDVVSR